MMNIRTLVASTSAAIGASLLSTSALAFTTIGFEDLENGQIVDNEFVTQGVTFSAVNTNQNFNYAVAFDTGATPTQDPDLLAPFTDFIESDFNNPGDAADQSFAGDVRDGDNGMIDPGKILIIQENNIGCGDGICDVPDDEANRPNGWFLIEFETPVFLSSIDFFDVEVEEDNSPDAQVTITTTAGSEIFFTPNTGGDFNYTAGMASASGSAFTDPGNYNTWDRQFYNVAEVSMIRINMGGSGGIDNIRFSTGVPAPTSLALTALGLLLLRRSRRN